jgi:hypothetical protein
MRKPPSGNLIRKITDTSQVHLDAINSPVIPDFAPIEIERTKPGKYSQVTIRVGKKP